MGILQRSIIEPLLFLINDIAKPLQSMLWFCCDRKARAASAQSCGSKQQ